MGCFLELSVRERALWRLLINHTHLQHAATLWHVRLGNPATATVVLGFWSAQDAGLGPDMPHPVATGNLPHNRIDAVQDKQSNSQ